MTSSSKKTETNENKTFLDAMAPAPSGQAIIEKGISAVEDHLVENKGAVKWTLRLSTFRKEVDPGFTSAHMLELRDQWNAKFGQVYYASSEGDTKGLSLKIEKV